MKLESPQLSEIIEKTEENFKTITNDMTSFTYSSDVLLSDEQKQQINTHMNQDYKLINVHVLRQLESYSNLAKDDATISHTLISYARIPDGSVDGNIIGYVFDIDNGHKFDKERLTESNKSVKLNEKSIIKPAGFTSHYFRVIDVDGNNIIVAAYHPIDTMNNISMNNVLINNNGPITKSVILDDNYSVQYTGLSKNLIKYTQPVQI